MFASSPITGSDVDTHEWKATRFFESEMRGDAGIVHEFFHILFFFHILSFPMSFSIMHEFLGLILSD